MEISFGFQEPWTAPEFVVRERQSFGMILPLRFYDVATTKMVQNNCIIF